MSTATGKAAFSQDEADIRALIEAAHRVRHDKDAAAIGTERARRMSPAPATQTALPTIENFATFSPRTKTPSRSATGGIKNAGD